MNPSKSGYIHVEPQLGEFVHGDGKLGTVPLQPGGQWDGFLPETHQQDENGFEPSDCVSEATINCVETLEIQEYGSNSGWARRFLAKNSGTDVKQGNDPQTVSETLRTQGTPFAGDYTFKVSDFATFYQALSAALKALAKWQFSRFNYGHSWVSADPNSMMAALEYSPLSAAGYAWQQDPQTGYYITPPGAQPEHDFTVYGYVRNNYWKVRDSYAPFNKQLAWDFKFTGMKRHTLHRVAGNTPMQATAWQAFMSWVRQICGFEGPSFGAARSAHWPQVQKAFLATHPTCSVCDKKGTLLNPLNVHHQRPFHLHPELELDPQNLITLCRVHHLWWGHLGNWSSFNVDVLTDSAVWESKIKHRP